jgi:hypothetical protein
MQYGNGIWHQIPYKQREDGNDPRLRKAGPAAPRPFLSLKFGLLMVGLGLGLIAAMLTVLINRIEDRYAVALYFGFVLIFGGIGLIISYAVEQRWLDKHKVI